jgi:hypothetical protein
MYTSILKADAFLTVDEVAEWLGIFDQIQIPAIEVKSFKTIQDLVYTSKLVGILGNAISIAYTNGATAGSEVVSLIGNAISVQIESGVSTSLQIKTAIENSVAAFALVGVAYKPLSTGVETQVSQVTTLLTGGTNAGVWIKGGEQNRKILERIINISCDKIEQIIQTSVVAKDYEEQIDGNNSNVIMPSKWPLVSITEIKIDYNRGFSSSTIVSPVNYFARGYADKRQLPGDTSLRIIGNDIILRDDGKDSIVGKIFSGSVLGSIKIKYKAGWALTNADIPWDLRQAATLLCEYYYFQRSNRDLNITSKGVRGESFTKIKDGIPDTIMEMVNPYADVSMPLYEKSQINVFGI